MHIRTLLGLLVAVLFAGAFFLFITVRDRSSAPATAEGALLFDLDPQSADLLKVETAAWKVECRKLRGRWRMLAPLEGAADIGRIDRILGELALLPREEVTTPEQMKLRGLTLESYGLDKPGVAITVRSGSSAPVTLHVGAPAPFPSLMFVKRSDETAVVTTRTNILAALPAEAGDFRDRRLLEGDPASVVRFELERRGSAFVLLARENGDWFLQEPFADRVDALRMRDLLRELLAAEVKDVVSDEHADPAAYGLGPDAVEAVLTLWLAGETSPARVEFGRPSGPSGDRLCVRLGGTGPILAIGTNLLSLLSFRAQDLRDRQRLRVQPEAVRGFTLETGERRLSARAGGGEGWQVTEPLQAKGDAERIGAFLVRLPALTAVGFDETATNEQPPLASVRLWTGEVAAAGAPAPADFQLRVLSAADGDRYRADTGTGGVFFLEGPAVRRVFGDEPFWDPLRFHDRIMVALSSNAVRRIALVRGEVEQVAERDEKGRWLAHDGRQVSPEALDALLRALSGLRAVRLELPAADEAAYGFETPAARLELGLDGAGGIQKTLLLGAALPDGGRFARVQGQDLVFVLPPEAGAVLMRDLLQ
jgi:hypothetical protein